MSGNQVSTSVRAENDDLDLLVGLVHLLELEPSFQGGGSIIVGELGEVEDSALALVVHDQELRHVPSLVMLSRPNVLNTPATPQQKASLDSWIRRP
jgi:hypothetical protein